MEKIILEKYLEDGLSLNKISKITGKSLTSIRYWKDKYSLKSKFNTFIENGKIEYGDYRTCPGCKIEIKTSNFYTRRKKNNSSTYCIECTNKKTIERLRILKSKMVEYKGGSCSRCGYNKYQGALEFHHLDPSQKDFNPSKLKKNKFDDKIKLELDKCILVCANCHREIHYENKLTQ